MSFFNENTRYSCQILMQTEFSRQISGKYANTKFNENPSSGTRVVPCGRKKERTDRQTDIQTWL